MSLSNQIVQQLLVVDQPTMKSGSATRVALFGEDGSPAQFGSGGGNSVVQVVDGSETRPSAPVVFWIGGNVKPTHMGSTDVWFASGSGPDTTAPSVPTSLFASSIGTDRFTLSWVSSTDNVAVDHYEYRLNGGAAVTATSPRLITGLTTSTLYNVEVRAFDAAGNPSAWSTALPVTTSAPAAFQSIFDSASPGTFNQFADGGGSLRVANRFYATRPLTVRGVRFWNPSTSDSAFLNLDMTFYVYTGDYTGSPMPAPTWASPLQTKAHTATRVAGQWTEVLFDTPVSILAVNPSSLGADTVLVGYQFADGNTYIHRMPVGGDGPIASTMDPTVYLGEPGLPRAHNTLGGGGDSHYGLDILFEAA